tara:strand:+ start:348 stop:689 length:342 start_codon:yes stop_codon:yes gene_type:complete
MKLAEKIIIILIVFLLGISYFPTKWAFAKDKLKFSTEEVRSMWYICSTQFQMVAPTIPQLERIRLCDCYVDHMRTTFTQKQVEALTPEQSRELGMKMNIICPTEMPFTIKEAT